MKWPTITNTVQTIRKVITPTTKKPIRRERTGGYWPDDDLADLERGYQSGWIDRKKTKGWLRR